MASDHEDVHQFYKALKGQKEHTMSSVVWVKVPASGVRSGDRIRISDSGPERIVRTVSLWANRRNPLAPGTIVLTFTTGSPWDGPEDFPFEKMEVI